MKKIMIFICGQVARKCSANGCFRSFNQRSDSFAAHEESEALELVAFNTCPGCDQNPLENLESKIEKFRKAGVDTIHIATCTRGRCNNYEAFADLLGNAGFNVVGYTHGSEGGKKENTIWITDGKKRYYK